MDFELETEIWWWYW